MHAFLEYLFDFDVLNAEVKPGWCEIYDETYISKTIIDGLENKLNTMGDLLSVISERATGKKSTLAETYGSTVHSLGEKISEEKEKFTPTQFEPFNLTQTKPKAIPKPILIPKVIPVKPVPATTYATNMQDVKAKANERKENIKMV